MESVLGRYRNLIALAAVLFAQALGLAVQIKRTSDTESTRLIRVWAVSAVTPFEKALVWTQTSTHDIWHNYFYLRGVRAENRELKAEIERMRLEQVRMSQDADQARRLQALLGFKEQFISQTMAAQVIGFSGSEQSRSIYIDKGEKDGIKPDMAVVNATGIVGKVLHVYRSTSLVLLINDQTSGVGAILEKSRLQGILRGTPAGEVVLEKVMSDETVQPGEKVLTSGGDQIFPKGLPIGTVTKVSAGPEVFLNVRVRPATNLSKLEEVLVITKKEERTPAITESSPSRAVDILSQRLPSVPDKPRETGEGGKATSAPGQSAESAAAAGSTTATTTPQVPKVAPVVKSTKDASSEIKTGTASQQSPLKPGVAQKRTLPPVKVLQQSTRTVVTPPKTEQPAATTAQPQDKPQ